MCVIGICYWLCESDLNNNNYTRQKFDALQSKGVERK